MSKYADRLDLEEALESAIEYMKGNVPLHTTTYADGERKRTLRYFNESWELTPLSADSIAKIRKKMNVSQGVFARMLNVSIGSVKSWEQGLRQPKGPSLKLLHLITKHPEIFV